MTGFQRNNIAGEDDDYIVDFDDDDVGNAVDKFHKSC